ncbi:Protein of unknown function [Cotesia congregata]|uniref:Uncharacterized protein n=1 Tax=Cotesia congregata TaxID=51543 RepID=A0A8J2HUG7_COTCN|nr:Protein of unknown function [Cotesia congregata]
MSNKRKNESGLSLESLEKKLKKYQDLIKIEKSFKKVNDSSTSASSSEDLDNDDQRQSQHSEHDVVVTTKDSKTSDESPESRLLKDKTYNLHPELSACWKEIVSSGLEKEAKTKLIDSYPNKGNCTLSAPVLNPELIPLLNKTAKSRDKYLTQNQDLCGRSLVALGQAISNIFNDDNNPVDKNELLQLLCDSSSLMCESMFQLGKSRRSQIYSCVDDKRKTVLEDSVTDEFRFGQDLSKRIKNSVTMEKTFVYEDPTSKEGFFKGGDSFKLEEPVCFTRQRQTDGLSTLPILEISPAEQDQSGFNPISSSRSEFKSIQSNSEQKVEVSVVAGQLKYFLHAWSNITSDPFILEIISGYKIPFTMTPIQSFIPTNDSFCDNDKIKIQGSMIIDPRNLIPRHLIPRLMIPRHIRAQHIFFGEFSYIPAYILQYILGYIPSIYSRIYIFSVGVCSQNVKISREFLESLGFIINEKKNKLAPSTSCKFLDFIFNSEQMTVELTQEKRFNIELILTFKNLTHCSIREFSQLVGNITAACPSINYGWLHSKKFEQQRYLELLKYCSWHRDPLAFCIDALTIDWNELNFFAFPPFSLILKKLKKIQTDQACGILVVPNWCGQPWYPLWLSLLDSQPIIFQPDSNLLRSSCTKNPLVSRLLKGAYNIKPAKSRYDRIYSLDPILDKLELLRPLSNLDRPQLTTKLAVLLALTTAHRIQTIASIKRCNIIRSGENYEIEIPDRMKTSKRGVFQQLLILPKFHKNVNLCVVSTLEKYLECTSLLAKNPINLFITTLVGRINQKYSKNFITDQSSKIKIHSLNLF